MTHSPRVRLRSSLWPLLLIILLGTALRFFRLGAQSLWFDEAARLAMALSDLSSILHNAGQDTLPPLFNLAQHFWLALGRNDYLARFLPAATGVLLMPVTHRLGRELFEQKTGLIATALVAIMPYQIYQSQQANLYSLLALLSGLQIWLFWQALRTNRWRHWLPFAICAILGLYTHYFTAFIIATLHLFLLIYRARYPRRWPRLLLNDGLIGLAFSPQLTNLIGQANQVFTNFWLRKPSPLAPLTTLYFFLASYSLPRWIAPPAMFIILAVLAIGLYELWLGLRNRQHETAPLLFLTLLTFFPVLSAFAISQLRPIFLERPLIVVTPAYLVLLGRALSTSRLRSPLPYLYLLMTGVLLFSLFHYYFDPTFAKPPLRQAADYVSNHFQKGDVVLHTSNSSYLPFLLYDPSPDHYLLQGDPAPFHPAEVFRLVGGEAIARDEIGAYQRLWLVVMLDHSLQYQREQVRWFDQHFPLIEETNVGGIAIRLYEGAGDEGGK